MRDGREELLERLTLVGWLIVILNGAAFCVLAPLFLFAVWPEVLRVGGQTTRYVMVAAFMAGGLPSFLLCKWLLEKCGVTVLRPPAPVPCSPEPSDRP